MKILALESSSTVCGAGIFSNEHQPIIKEREGNRIHIEVLPLFIDELLNKYKIHLSEFDGIAVSAGPGSFTGLRIGMSLAKGLSLGCGIPILPVNTAHSLISENIEDQNYSLVIYSHSGLVYEQVVRNAKIEKNIQFHNFERVLSEQIYGVNFPKTFSHYSSITSIQPSVKWIGKYAMSYFDELVGKPIQEISPFYYSDFQVDKLA